MLIEQDETSYSISKLFHSTQLNLHYDETRAFFDIKPKNGEIVIRKDFIVALVNLEILSELNIPLISVSLVKKENFLI